MEANNLTLPNSENKLLLHCCCAPCSGGIIESLIESNIDLTVFFYNPNIHPKEEYERRKGEIIRFVEKKGLAFVDSDYDPSHWLKRVEGLEMEPERGKRCSVCFDMRLERSALFAIENKYQIFTSTFGISRWKDKDQVDTCGIRAASRYPGLVYWAYNWRKLNGSARMSEITKREGFYQQKYCGCTYSRRDSAQKPAKGRKTPNLASKS